MNNHSQQIVQKLWNYCNVLRDDGMSYGDYVERDPPGGPASRLLERIKAKRENKQPGLPLPYCQRRYL